MTSNNSMSSGGSAPSDGFGASLISAGSIMTILDPSGSTVYSGEAASRAAFVFFSSADLNTDKTYTHALRGQHFRRNGHRAGRHEHRAERRSAGSNARKRLAARSTGGRAAARRRSTGHARQRQQLR